MNIKEDIYSNYFFTSHINNLVMDETKPYSLFGYSNARIFKDTSTDSFVEKIFLNKDKLIKFIDYTFYSIFTKIPNIHKLLYTNGYFMNEKEYIKIIFKGGNIMSFFFEIILDSITKNKPEIFDYKLNQLNKYLTAHGVDLKITDNELFYAQSEETIKDFFNEQKKKFKISDVDYTIYINSNESVKYNIISQLYNKILINSLDEIRIFFDSYYLNIRESTLNKEIEELMTNKYLPFKSNDNPYIQLLSITKELINLIKLENTKNFYTTNKSEIKYSISVENDFLEYFFKYKICDVLLSGCEFKNYLNVQHAHYKLITNLRLIVEIFEYLELLQIYFDYHKKYSLKSTVQDLLIITKKIIDHHMNNKKKIIMDSEMYSIESINEFLNSIASKYNKQLNPSLYNTKYSLSFDKKNHIQKINMVRKDPNTNLIFNYLEPNEETNKDNEIDIVKKSDSISYSTNDVNLYGTITYTNKYFHYITYNNCVYNSHSLYARKFDLFRIKFNIALTKPMISIDDSIKDHYNIPSEFVDVSIPSFQDINRKKFYDEIQHEGINILNYSDGSINYYWDTYSIHQLFDDLVNILFGPIVIPWYDAKYDKRIIRLLLLFSFYKIEKSNCEWICFLSDILKLTNKLYIYATNKDLKINDELFLSSIKSCVLGPDHTNTYTSKESDTIMNYILDNIYYKLDELGYNQIIKINDYYKDFEFVVRFLIFYSYSMKKSCFFNTFNNIRLITGLLPYEPNKSIKMNGVEYDTIEYNNSKFVELLKVISNTVSVILFFLNETNESCGMTNLTKCGVKVAKTNCDLVSPIAYNFNSPEYKYYTNVIGKNDDKNENKNIIKTLIGKKYIIIDKKN